MAALCFLVHSKTWARLPNIILIYADDLRLQRFSCYNPQAAYQTPNLDRLQRKVSALPMRTVLRRSVRLLGMDFVRQQVHRTGRRPPSRARWPVLYQARRNDCRKYAEEAGYRTGVFGK